jgi:cob(I)alamin adenosyltransferase
MKIYTKTGDDGTTGLYGGDRISKTSARIQALGDVDELNAALGIARVSASLDLDDELARIQCWLFDLGAELAAPPGTKFAGNRIREYHASRLEASIDDMTTELAPLHAFILPGGGRLGADLHLARAICRRAERSVLHLSQVSPVSEDARMLLNRLSDWLFVAARTANAQQGVQDMPWRPTEEN